jgi:AraC-like DNA-binding protein
MKGDETLFFRSCEQNLEIVYCKNSSKLYPNHTHVNNFTIGMILAGSILISQNDIERECLAGNVFIIPPNLAHSIRPKQEPYSIFSLCIHKDFIYDCELTTLIQKVRASVNNLIKDNIINLEQCDTLIDTVTIIYENLSEVELRGTEGVKQAQKLLMNTPENPFPIEMLAKEVCVSPYHLIRSFKQQVGLTPHQFQIQNRVRKAQHLLCNNSNITEVALTTGFCDQSHFDKCFQKIVGMSPSDYLKAQRELNTDE